MASVMLCYGDLKLKAENSGISHESFDVSQSVFTLGSLTCQKYLHQHYCKKLVLMLQCSKST